MTIKSMLATACLLLSASSTHAASFEFYTAGGDSQLGVASMLNDDTWIFHRFELTETTHIGSVGGDFINSSGSSLNVFGAIVNLLSGFDNPPQVFDSSTPGVVATALVNVGTVAGDYDAPVNVTLAPGWYALEFGTGAMNASSISGVNLRMRSFDTDLDPGQTSVTVFQNPRPGQNTFQPINFSLPRLYVTPVPIPAAVWLFGSGLLGLLALARRKHS